MWVDMALCEPTWLRGGTECPPGGCPAGLHQPHGAHFPVPPFPLVKYALILPSTVKQSHVISHLTEDKTLEDQQLVVPPSVPFGQLMGGCGFSEAEKGAWLWGRKGRGCLVLGTQPCRLLAFGLVGTSVVRVPEAATAGCLLLGQAQAPGPR